MSAIIALTKGEVVENPFFPQFIDEENRPRHAKSIGHGTMPPKTLVNSMLDRTV